MVDKSVLLKSQKVVKVWREHLKSMKDQPSPIGAAIILIVLAVVTLLLLTVAVLLKYEYRTSG